MKKTLVALVVVLLVGVVLAGCLGGQNETQTNQPETQGQEIKEEGASEVTSGGKIDLSNIENLAQLAKLGFGIKCTGKTKTTSPEGTYEATVEYYMKGNKYKVITKYGTSEQAFESVVISPGDGFIYVKPSKELEESLPNLPCKWIKIEQEESEGNQQEEETMEEYSVSYETPEQIHVDQTWECHKEDIPDSMFQIEGQACTMEEMMAMAIQMAMGQY